MIYILFFLLSTSFIGFAEFLTKKKIMQKVDYSKFSINFFIILGILTVSILNGVRDLNIGTDMLVYGNRYFEIAQFTNNFFEYTNITYANYFTNVEFGYQFLNYIVSRFTSNIHVFYFILGLITNSIFYLGIKFYKKDVSVTISWLVYLFLFYGNTLNIMRQSVAIGFVFYGISYLLYKNKYMKSLFLIFLGTLFHQSAYFGLLIIILYYVLKKYGNTFSLHIKIIIASMIMSFSSFQILNFLTLRGILNDKFTQYVGINRKESEVGVTTLGMRLPYVFYGILFYKTKILKNFILSFVFLLLIFDLIFLPLREIDITVSRITLYFAIFKIISYPLLIKNTVKKSYYIIMNILLIIFCILTWYLQYIIGGNGDIYPFTSNILDNLF